MTKVRCPICEGRNMESKVLRRNGKRWGRSDYCPNCGFADQSDKCDYSLVGISEKGINTIEDMLHQNGDLIAPRDRSKEGDGGFCHSMVVDIDGVEWDTFLPSYEMVEIANDLTRDGFVHGRDFFLRVE